MCLVDEMRTKGSHFTWTNKQANEDRIYSKLDIIFINEDWLDLFPHAEAVVNWEMLSDHCFCIIKLGATLNCGIKPFRFFNMWTSHDNFKEIVMQSWCKPSKGYGLERIVRKLGRLKQVLRKFNKSTVGDVVQNYNTVKDNYQAAQLSLQSDPHSSDFQRKERLEGRKVNRYGDDNTTYFHACLKQRRASNRITSFVNESGQLIKRFEDVVAHFVNHFQKIMGSQSNASVPIQRSCFRLGHRLSLDQQIFFIKPFTRKEVEDSLFIISPIKILGPDGYGSGFFKAMWKDMGAEISEAILDFFERGLLPEEMNKATISLIPKIETPTKAMDYWPIACCNTIYKCISKMLCGRLTKVLPSLVNQNQGAFVKNRLLAHNILILQDFIKGYTRKNISPRCLMKIDLSKAYDMLDWHFLEDILIAFCFPNRFIKWVMTCLKDTTYLILMNGRIQGGFRRKNGLRQGDHISPLLFVLVMEYFTRLLCQASMNKDFWYHPKCKNLKIDNLCFADDLTVSLSFSLASGLSANLKKSQVRAKMEEWLGRDIWPSMYEEWSSWMVGKPKGLKQKVAAAAMAAAVYMDWRNRNKCIFEFSSLPVGFVDQLIKYYLKNRLTRLPKLKVEKNDLAFFENFVQL
ncbi:uncharacterized protein LOC133832420 [Humulus lupulus]|uniref:uncharacterized protein LOC133832420 n=1 Tax=Humulus lupulus TaxID=3486 RepID=UPI002B401E8B|nr:uncharacterized protein LOC133832420 [Humulus lupulus]